MRTSLTISVALALALGGCAVQSTGWGNGNGSGSGSGNGNGNGGDTDSGASTTPDPQGDSGTTTPTKDAGTTSPKDSGTTTQDAGQQIDAGDGFDQFQHRNLDDINSYRATLNIAPLVLDKTLSDFAYAGSQELTQDHTPHQHFITASNNNTLWTSGFNTQAGENQGDPNGWYVMSQNPVTNELDQIDDIQKQMFNEGPGTGEAHGHYMNMMNSKFKRVGVGLIEVNGSLYLTNDFSD
jgi:uncharacterized protein YkwD